MLFQPPAGMFTETKAYLLGIEQRIKIVHLIVFHSITTEPIRMDNGLVGAIHFEIFSDSIHKFFQMFKPGLIRLGKLIQTTALRNVLILFDRLIKVAVIL